MDSAMYTLIGALGGILITQAANYLLESKRAKNNLSIKKLELKETKSHEIYKSRREAYSNYLIKADDVLVKTFLKENKTAHPVDINGFMNEFYTALILSGDDVMQEIKNTFEIINANEIDTKVYKKAKVKLLEAMKNEFK